MIKDGGFDFETTAFVTLGLPTAFCINLFFCHRRIDEILSLYLVSTLFVVQTGCRLMHVWLGMNYAPGISLPEFDMKMDGIFLGQPFAGIKWIFFALTVHGLVYVLGRLIELMKARQLNMPTLIHLGTGLASVVGIVLLLQALWGGPYRELYHERARIYGDAHGHTEAYLLQWLSEEPDSPQAQLLYQNLKKRKAAFSNSGIRPKQ